MKARAKLVPAVLALLVMLTGVLVPQSPAHAAACATGNDVTISISCEWAGGTHVYTGTLTINAGITVTADSNGGTPVEIVVDNLTLNGTITAIGEGAAAESGTGPGDTGQTGSGGGHGGNGGMSGAGDRVGGIAYGSTFGPISFGSGGGDDTNNIGQQGGAGGGAIKIFMTGNGTIAFGNGAVISASGTSASANDGGGGAGGSIWIDATNGTVTAPANGLATISANGGSSVSSEAGGGGGGGRIAITYGTFNNQARLNIHAFGGQGGTQSGEQGQRGGAGTIYLKAAAATNGDLIVDNSNAASSFLRPGATTQTASSTQVFDTVAIRNNAQYVVPSGFSLSATGTLTGGSAANRQPSLTIDGTFTPPSSTLSLDGLDVTQNATLATVTTLSVRNGQYTLSASGSLFTAGAGNRLGSLTLDANSRFSVTTTGVFHVDTLTVNSGGILTHATNTNFEAHKLDVSATTSITVNSGGSIDVDGKGHQNGTGPGVGGQASTVGSGGGYGGNGGNGSNAGGVTYGDPKTSFLLGSGGGNANDGDLGGDGGGAVRLTAPTITINSGGILSADGSAGSNDGGGGSGGTAYIDATTSFAGTGTITANGGGAAAANNGGGGGGGRIVIYHAGSLPSQTRQTFGGVRGTASGNQLNGGAGTIFIKSTGATNGDLSVINNYSTNLDDTTQSGSASQTFDNVTIRQGAQYVIPSGSTLDAETALSGGGTTKNGKVTIDGTLDSPSASLTLDGLDVDQDATFGTVTSLTVRNGYYELSASGTLFTAGAGNRLTSLTLNSGSIFSVDTTGPLYLDSLTVNSGGILTHATNTSSHAHHLDVSATTSINVASGGAIRVDNKGYAGGAVDQNGFGAGGGGTGGFAGGGGHGGRGGTGGTAGATNDSVTAPFDLGSGGGGDDATGDGGDGGGYVRLRVPSGQTITVAGTVEADGESTTANDEGAGAGGSIYIDAVGATVTGAGTLTATGGNSDTVNGGGGGGGGRIAVRVATNTLSAGSPYNTQGGNSGSQSTSTTREGGAGTIYLKLDAQTNGDLIVDNNNQTNNNFTAQLSGTETYDNVTIREGADYLLPSGSTLAIASGGTLTGGGTEQPKLQTSSGGTFTPSGGTFTFNDIDVVNNGTISTVTALTVTAATFDHNATGDFSAGGGVTSLTLSGGSVFTYVGSNLNLSSLTVPTGTEFYLENERYYPFAENFGALSVSGRFSQDRYARLFMGSLTIPSGGVVTHASNTASIVYRVDISATSSIDVQSGGFINVDQRGYTAENGPGKGESAGNSTGGGGAYGGGGGEVLGGADGGDSYGFIERPEDAGSGGGDDIVDGGQQGGSGGGIVRLIVGSGGTITVNGTVSANGELGKDAGDGGGGAGGSIWIDAATNTIAGTGTVRANGARCSTTQACGGGGGGRIAIYYTSGNPDNWTKQAFGGMGGNQGGTTSRQGGAGTIYVKSAAETDGDLIVDNNNLSSSKHTRLFGALTQQFKNIIIRNGSCFRIPNLFRLRKGSGAFTFGGSTRPCLQIDTGGKLDPGSGTFNPDGLDLDSSGELEGVSNMTVTNGSIDNTMTFGGGCTALTIGSGGSLNFVDSATFTCSTVTVQSGGKVTQDDNSTSLVRKILVSVTTMDVQSGGIVTAGGNGFDSATGTAPGTSGTQAGGGGHGGAGGQGSGGQAGGTTYGDSTWPETLGSGGGADTDGAAAGGSGGGVIKLVVSGTLTVSGTISATGTNGTGAQAGGGAGGSVLIVAGTWAGTTGCITANGGNGAGSTTGGGGGGGGRIAVFYTTKTYTGCGLTVTGGAKGGTGAATAGAAGSTYEDENGPAITSVTHSPSVPTTVDNVSISASATYSGGIDRIELYLDGTAAFDLRRTCALSSATSGSCTGTVGQLSRGSHTTTVKVYGVDATVTTDDETFTVDGFTTSNQSTLSRLKAGATAVFTLTYTLSATATQNLVVTFPGAFTVNSAFTSGSSCLSSFGFTSSTLTANSIGCNGTVTATGAVVTNPSTPGLYTITWTDDSGYTQVAIVDDDQVTVSGTVDPVITFNVGTQTASCDGTFTGAGGTLAFGSLSTSSVASSDVSSVPHICSKLTTNAGFGAQVTVTSQNGALRSVGTPAHTIPSSTATLAPGTAGYGLCVGSGGGDTGRDTTTPASALPTASAPFNGACSTSSHEVGALSTSPTAVWTLSGPSQNAFARLFVKAAIAASTIAHNDYADVLTFIATATY